jgi:PD-(D/E)XK endonuclease
VEKPKAKIIKDKKRRGEWAESVFMARAGEHGLPVSKPWGDSDSFDCVVGRPGKFAAVQVKSTVTKLESGKGYICSTCGNHKVYRAGAFDFLAAYVIPEDVWYIIPAEEIRGLKSISLCTYGGEAKYEQYREAWDLLRKAAGITDDGKTSGEELDSREAADGMEPQAVSSATGVVGRMKAVESYVRNFFERGSAGPQKLRKEVREEDA